MRLNSRWHSSACDCVVLLSRLTSRVTSACRATSSASETVSIGGTSMITTSARDRAASISGPTDASRAPGWSVSWPLVTIETPATSVSWTTWARCRPRSAASSSEIPVPSGTPK